MVEMTLQRPALKLPCLMTEKIGKPHLLSEEEALTQLYSSVDTRPNIILIGMPGAGKSSVAAALAKLAGLPCYDTDQMIIEMAGKSIPEIFAEEGEPAFRLLERQAIAKAAQFRASIIACGGGAPLNAENQYNLRQCGQIYWLQRSLELLPTHGRPLSKNLEALYEQRSPIYQSLANQTISNDSTIEDAARRIWEFHQLAE